MEEEIDREYLVYCVVKDSGVKPELYEKDVKLGL